MITIICIPTNSKENGRNNNNNNNKLTKVSVNNNNKLRKCLSTTTTINNYDEINQSRGGDIRTYNTVSWANNMSTVVINSMIIRERNDGINTQQHVVILPLANRRTIIGTSPLLGPCT